jgi:hypothetical protein
MTAKKIITVFGATGAQGGGLVRAICADPRSEFIARAVTRDVNSEKAKELAKLGAEVVKGDLSDAASVHKALEGAYGAFFVTFFWAHYDPEQRRQRRPFLQKLLKKRIKHAIWSTLEDTRELVRCKMTSYPHREIYKVPHFDAKENQINYSGKRECLLLFSIVLFTGTTLFISAPGLKGTRTVNLNSLYQLVMQRWPG